MDKWRRKTALVTGANSGIGAAITKKFLENDMIVHGLDKMTNYLEEMKTEFDYEDRLFIYQIDVTETEEALNVFKEVEENCEELNVVVVCAGIIGNNSLIDGEFSEWQDMVDVNIIGFCLTLKESVNIMLRKNVTLGQVILMNSVQALGVTQTFEQHFYSATKRAEKALAEGLTYELRQRRSKIKVTTLYLGLVRTRFYKNSIGEHFETPLYKTAVTLTTDDVLDVVEYVLNTSPDMQVDAVKVAPRGMVKQYAMEL